MGMDHSVHFPPGQVPAWSTIRDLLAQRGLPPQVAMIDGELSFPDEEPPEAWRELRLRTPLGMITLRRETDRLVCVTWGNADADMRQAWNAVAWACAAAGGGRIAGQSAEEFLQSAELPAFLRETGTG